MPSDGLCVYINELVRIKYTPQCTQKLSKHDLRNMLETCDCCSFGGCACRSGVRRGVRLICAQP